MLAGDRYCKAFLNSLAAEACIPADRAAQFFTALSAATYTSSDQAYSVAENLIKANIQLKLQGRVVPPDRFAKVTRLVKQSSAGYLLSETSRAGYGLTDADIEAMSKPTLDLFLSASRQQVTLGNRLGISWVADHAELTSSGAASKQWIDRLGLDTWSNETVAIQIVVERSQLGVDLRVPRAFDAVDNPQFELEPDCAAPVGRTRPLSSASTDGFSEAVHSACNCQPETVDVKLLE